MSKSFPLFCFFHSLSPFQSSVCVCVCVCLRVRPGARGAGSNPPSRSRRSPPAVLAVLMSRPGAVPPTAGLGCRVSSEPPSRSKRSHTWATPQTGGENWLSEPWTEQSSAYSKLIFQSKAVWTLFECTHIWTTTWTNLICKGFFNKCYKRRHWLTT